jgi:hypothetical protein
MSKINIPLIPAVAVISALERDSRILHAYMCDPKNDISPELIRRHCAQIYSLSETLVELAEEARKQQAEANEAAA